MSSIVLYFEKLIRKAVSMRCSGSFISLKTRLFLPFAHAEPLETKIPFDDKKLSIVSDFISFGIFNMWEAEQITGNPRNSLYIRRD